MLLFSSSASLLVGRAPPQRAAGIALRAPLPVMSAGDDVARTFPGDESYVLEKLLDDDKDAALDIDVQGVVEEIDQKGTDAETDAGFDSAVIIIGAGAGPCRGQHELDAVSSRDFCPGRPGYGGRRRDARDERGCDGHGGECVASDWGRNCFGRRGGRSGERVGTHGGRRSGRRIDTLLGEALSSSRTATHFGRELVDDAHPAH